MAQVSIAQLAQRGAAFGTSGVRGTVDALDDRVCYAYTSAFLEAVLRVGASSASGGEIAIGQDLRPSSPRIAAACLAACRDHGLRPVVTGALPTPALAHYALERRVPAVMVTGSHIPFDRNGIKFFTAAGEILKQDEAAIAGATVDLDDARFDARGMLKDPPPLPPADPGARDLFRDRYLRFFRPGLLRGKRVGVYQHSSVARDLATELLAALGAEAVALGRTDTFVPVDTEAISEDDERRARAWVAEHRLDAVVSTDGDADRPLVGDETGALLRGDVVGILCARFVGARTVVTPVSSNTAVERWGVFEKVVRTRIGSPYVVAAMEEAARAGGHPVVGFEANGGVLLGSDVKRAVDGREATLAALPTRDAMLPILSILATAVEAGTPVSRVRAALPARHTASDRIQNFPTETSRQLLARLASSREALERFFGELGPIAEVNQVDGVRVTLASGDIVHLRPSGNAPELRCYAESGSRERALELTRWGLAAARAAAGRG